MGFKQKVGSATKNKKAVQSPKPSMFELDANDDDDDLDIEMDSDDDDGQEPPKTAGKRTLQPKIPGKQTSAKQTPGKQTPSSQMGKRQATPASKGKQDLQKFKGLNKSKTSLKMDEDDEEEDDDDDDDSKQIVLKRQLKQKIGDKQNDEEDDEEEEEDDEDEDEEEDEEEEDEEEDDSKQNAIKSKSKQKKENDQNSQQVKNKDPLKKKASNPTKTDNSLTKNEKNLAIVQKNKIAEDKRDARQLMIRNLPVDVTYDELKSLSDDIIHVILPDPDIIIKRKFHTIFCFVEFASEKKAEENYAAFQSQKFRGVPIVCDYAGVKSRRPKAKGFGPNTDYCTNKLVVPSLPASIKVMQIAKLTPSATSIVTTSSTFNNMAFVTFDTEEAADKAFEANQEAKINGRPVIFLYAKTSNKPFKRHILKEKKEKGKLFKVGGQPPLAKRPRQDLDASSQD